MSLQFLGQKSWHPASKANQKRVWVAEQRAKEREEREREKAKEVRKAAEALQAQQAAAAAGDAGAARRAASQQVNFLYAAPPGLPEAKDEAQHAKQTQGGEDEAVREFRRRAERRGEPQRKLERYVGRRAEETLTIKDQVERFPILKDAPVEGKYTETIRVNFNPVGLWLRNVRCIRCGEWGHQSGDRECKLRDHNPNDATRQRWEDPVTEINKLKSAKQELVFRRGALPLEMQEAATNEYEILQSDDEDVEAAEDAFLANLSSKQKRKLMKKLQKESRGDWSSSDSDSASDVSLSRRHRSKKKKKSSKHKRKHKRKHRSRGRSKGGVERSKESRNPSRRRDASLSPQHGRQSYRRSRSRSHGRDGQHQSSRT